MKRDPAALKDQEFDVIVVGGGAFGASAAREAALRNYSVALVEAGDFGCGTSANSFKFVHGGIRYLQHLDFSRLRESYRERSALLRIAPHLVRPLPVAMPTYGHGRNGKAFLGTGFRLYDLLTADRNRGIRDRTRHVPATGFLSRAEVLRRFEGVEPNNLTGAACFSDAQMYHPPRLVFSFVRSAVDKGAVALNYVQAESLIRRGDRICGVSVTDRLSGERFDVHGRVIVNAAGPWSEAFLRNSGDVRIADAGVYSRDACFLVDGGPEKELGLAVQGTSIDKGAVIGRGARHLFVVPWRGYRLIGVWHVVYRKGPDSIHVTEEELDRFLNEFNTSLPAMAVRREDIRLVNAGLVPFGDSDETGAQLNFGKRSHLVDSERAHGLQGLVTLIGVRHTMARGDAAKALDIVDRKLKRSGASPDSAFEPLPGGDLDNVAALEREVEEALGAEGSRAMAAELTALYGSEAIALIERGRRSGGLARVKRAGILGVQVDTAIEEEMAVTLGDVVFRRTPLAAAGNPGDDVLRACAEAMGAKSGWSAERIRRELDAVSARFPTASHCGRISGEGDVETLEAGTPEPACRGL